MGKIGRNDPCPCGSGKKFKKCCLSKEQDRPAAGPPPSLTKEAAAVQEAAGAKRSIMKTLGVFLLFATETGDAWLLEATDMDAIQLAAAGEKRVVEINENPETIEINWTHRFAVKNKKFVLTAYQDNSERIIDTYPTQAIQAAVKKIRKKIPPELLRNIHVDEAEAAGAAG